MNRKFMALAGALVALCLLSVAAQAQGRAQLSLFATLGGNPDSYHMTEAPDGSYFVANFSSSSLVRLSASGTVLERMNTGFIFTTSVVFLSNDVGYTTCNPAPFASRGFCLSGRSGCPRGEGVSPGNINGVSVPRYALGADGLTSQSFFISNGGTGQILRVIPSSRSVTTVAGGFTIASVSRDTRGPEQIAYNRATRTLFVADSGQNTVVAVDEQTGSRTVIRSGLNYPFGLALLPNGNLLVANRGDGTLTEISQQGQLTGTYDTGQGANALRGLTVNSRGEIFIIADRTQTIWRVTLPVVQSVANASAASYRTDALAREIITAAFGTSLATATEAATQLPLPTILAGTTVSVRDSAGVERNAPLFFVSPTQVNYLIPPDTAAGAAVVTITSGSGALSGGAVQIAGVAPGLFTADASGAGAPAGFALRVRGDGSQVIEPLAQFDPAQNRFVAVPVDLSSETDQVFLVLFGTGLRFHGNLAGVTARIGGANVEVLFAGAQGGFAGLDQINLRLPRTLAGRGEADLELSVNGLSANPVRINIR
ncbi:MAG TPA: hypothetical protein VNQ79_21065 [Blastocatellia bacterium]|nr:hypothetical protein [Blastocatellia bacterium]